MIEIGGTTVERGQHQSLEIPVSRLPTETMLTLPVHVLHGLESGPTMWLSAAVHGDELNGIEIIRRVLKMIRPTELRGTLLAVPVVNVFGLIQQSRYLPDRRDLNRSFPGTEKGSTASRLARLFMDQVVARCQYGIDLHTGSNYRTNYPQIRANLNNQETRECAEAFGAPVLLHSETRDGSLRQAADLQGIHILLYEAGEPLRFNESAIEVGVAGILRVMQRLSMYDSPDVSPSPGTLRLESARWVRARRGGIMRLEVELGEEVAKGEILGVISDAGGRNESRIRASESGIVIGLRVNPIVHQGDGVLNIGVEPV